MLVVGEEGEVRRRIDGDAGLQARRNVEVALLGEQAAVVLELVHVDTRVAGDAEPQARSNRPFDARAHAAAPRDVGAGVAEVRGSDENPLNAVQAFDLDLLAGEDRRNADREARSQRLGEGDREKRLLQVDAGLAKAERAGPWAEWSRRATDAAGGGR